MQETLLHMYILACILFALTIPFSFGARDILVDQPVSNRNI